MPITVLMPALSPTMEKGKLAKWLKQEGDAVKSGDVLAEIETDKATMEVEAVDEGVIGKLLVAAGSEDVAVNTPIAVILAEGETMAAASSPPPAAPKPAPQPAGVAPAAAPASPAATPAAAHGSRVLASPLARRLARERGINLAALAGSGPHGRIVLKDVEQAQPGAALGAAPAAAPRVAGAAAAAPQPMSDDAVLKLFPPDNFDLVPHDSMRKVIARRLMEAKLTIPHFYVSVDVTLDTLLALRERLNAQAPKDDAGKPLWKLSVNDFIIKAMALALIKVPDANVTWTEAAMLRHRHADVGVAVSIPGGLITPVLRRAEEKGLARISTEMKDYAARARARKLMPEDYTGGSAAISNMGMMNVRNFAAIINPPHAAILAVGSAEERAVVRGGTVQVETQMTMTLSTDHRCIDGALGAIFINAIKAHLEEPGLMLV
jgi:pyruvate dehydrogenase E2 component (dihydrolipoamide acetyltransferase)